MAREMYPELSIPVGRDIEPPNSDTFDTIPVVFSENRRGPRNDPQHFQTQRRHHMALRLQHHRHPADDAIALRNDGKKSAARGDFFENRDVAQQTGKLEEVRLGSRFVAKRRKSRERKVLVDFRNHRFEPGLTKHHTGTPERIGQGLVVTRQSAQPASGQFIQVAHIIGQDVRVQPVGFGKNHVESNGNGAKIGKVDDHVRQARARPRPLAELLQARFIDVDDGDRTRRLHARIEALVEIESPDPEFFDRRKIGDAQRRDPDQQEKAHQPRKAEPPPEPAPDDFETAHACKSGWSNVVRSAGDRGRRISNTKNPDTTSPQGPNGWMPWPITLARAPAWRQRHRLLGSCEKTPSRRAWLRRNGSPRRADAPWRKRSDRHDPGRRLPRAYWNDPGRERRSSRCADWSAPDHQAGSFPGPDGNPSSGHGGGRQN